jgi:cysteine desulfuration protein SufE
MNSDQEKIPERLHEIMEEFELCEGREKIELLLEYAERLPELPERLRQRHDEMELVQECMTPVYVQAETESGRMTFHFDVPPESPTVRGFAAIMAEGMHGVSPQTVLGVPNDFFYAMGLERVLTMQRLNGMAAILVHMKRLAAQASDTPALDTPG